MINHTCTFSFVFGQTFIDRVTCDITGMDCCGILLGKPYQFDRRDKYDAYNNTYTLNMDGNAHLIRCTSPTTSSNLLITCKQVKKVATQAKSMALIFVREQQVSPSPTISINDSPMEISILLDSYQHVFKEPSCLPPIRSIKHSIDLQPGASLPNCPLYRTSASHNDEIKKQIHDLLDRGLIKPIISPCASLIILVEKKDGTWHLCVDFRALNKVTIKNRYLFPRIDDLLDQFQGAKYFFKIDLKSGYHQVRIKPGYTWKASFKTR